MPQDDLDKLVQVLCADDRAPVLDRLKREGFAADRVVELLSRPDATRAVFTEATRRFLLPVVPKILKSLAERAESGQAAAQATVLALLGDKSPVKEAAGMDLASADDTALLARASQLSSQLGELVKSLGHPIERNSTGTKGDAPDDVPSPADESREQG